MNHPRIWSLVILLSLLLPSLVNTSNSRDKEKDDLSDEVKDTWTQGEDRLFPEYSPISPSSEIGIVKTGKRCYDMEAFYSTLAPLHGEIFEYINKEEWIKAASNIDALEDELRLFEAAATKGMEDESTMEMYVGYFEELVNIRASVNEWKKTLCIMNIYPVKKKASSHSKPRSDLASLEEFYPSSKSGLGFGYKVPEVLKNSHGYGHKDEGYGSDIVPKGRHTHKKKDTRFPSSLNPRDGTKERQKFFNRESHETWYIPSKRGVLPLEEINSFVLAPPEHFYGGEHVGNILRGVYELIATLEENFNIPNKKTSCGELVITMNRITTQLDLLVQKTIPTSSDSPISYYQTFLKPVSVYLNRILAGYFKAAAQSIEKYCGSKIQSK